MAETAPSTDVFIAVHGIGAQQRSATVRSVGTQLAGLGSLEKDDRKRPLAPQPLGYFHRHFGYYGPEGDADRTCPLDDDPAMGDYFKRAKFAEVFWADIPQEIDREGRTLEETKAWARTVVARARRLYHRACPDDRAAARHGIVTPDFSLASEVLDEVIDTVQVLENLTYLADKAGIFTFDLDQVLREYLGDVQLVAEFRDVRCNIIGKFHEAMREIYKHELKRHEDLVKDLPEGDRPPLNLRFHVVAHSEGTVVAFLGLLHALSDHAAYPYTPELGDAAPVRPGIYTAKGDELHWLRHVHSMMTIGSPIDKHLLLWERLWKGLDPKLNQHMLQSRIRWRNYYDYGDPVGFNLETARAWLRTVVNCDAFEFEPWHDYGFCRYIMPGKAHNDYWEDEDVFDHFVRTAALSPVPALSIDDVRTLHDKQAEDYPEGSARARKKFEAMAAAERQKSHPPGNRGGAIFWSTAIPYLLSFFILFVGTDVLYSAVTAYMHPQLDQMQRFVRFSTLGTVEESGATGGRLLLYSLGVTFLTAGVTLCSRFPRLAKSRAWWCVGLMAFFLGCVGYAACIDEDSRREIASGISAWLTPKVRHLLGAAAVPVKRFLNDFLFIEGGTVWVFAGSFIVAAIGWLGKPHAVDVREDRRERWFRRGMRPLIVAGAVIVILLVALQVDVKHRQKNSSMKLDTKSVAEEFMSGLEKGKDSGDVSLAGRIRRALLTGDISASKLEGKLTDKSVVTNEPNHGMSAEELTTRNRKEVLRDLDHALLVSEAHPRLWPLLFSLAAFLYLWWLAALLFDLTFIWHRYIRHNKTNDFLLTCKKADWASALGAARQVKEDANDPGDVTERPRGRPFWVGPPTVVRAPGKVERPEDTGA